jgi:metal-responsive CopG/Arc/MetJ family transcriptional regulator
MVDEPEYTQECKSVQVILKVPESFLKRFDKTIIELGYSRTEAIREAMRRFQQDGEKRLGERPENVFENLSKLYADQQKQIVENYKRLQEEKQKQIIWMQPKKQETGQPKLEENKG